MEVFERINKKSESGCGICARDQINYLKTKECFNLLSTKIRLAE